MTAPESARSEVQGEGQRSRQELLAELRQFARAIKDIDGAPTREIEPPAVTLPLILKDRRGRVVEVWDVTGRQISFFYSSSAAAPFAYEMRDRQGAPVEWGSSAGAASPWAVFKGETGGGVSGAAQRFAHQLSRVEVSAEGVMLAEAADGYQLRRDPCGGEYEAVYDSRGCLVEAVRRHREGHDRTVWRYEDGGDTVAREERADGSTVETRYDQWGRMLERLEQAAGRELATYVEYDPDGSHRVRKLAGGREVCLEERRKDGTLSRCREICLETGEQVARKFDRMARLVEEERISTARSQVTAWRHGEDGWLEVSQNSSDGKSLLVRYDAWGRLVLQKESGRDGQAVTAVAYKPDGSYHVHRSTSDGLEADEYYRPDGTRHHSRASNREGHVVEVDYDAQGRPMKRTSTAVHHYQ